MQGQIKDWVKGDSFLAVHLNEPLPTVRSVRTITGAGDVAVSQLESGTTITVPPARPTAEHALVILTNAGPSGESDFTGNGQYWAKLAWIGSSYYNAPVSLLARVAAPNPTSFSSSQYASAVVVPVTNLPEAQTVSGRLLATDGSVWAHAWVEYDRGTTDVAPQKHWVMEVVASSPWITVKILGPDPGDGITGGPDTSFGGGKYTAAIYPDPTSDTALAGDLATSDFGADQPSTGGVRLLNLDELGRGNVHQLRNGTYVEARIVHRNADDGVATAVCNAGPKPYENFIVKMNATGTIGNKTTASSWTYTCWTMYSGQTLDRVLATGVSPLTSRPHGTLAAGSFGIACWDDSGNLLLIWVNEQFGEGGC
jgi:hypothetical protein